MVLLAYWLFSQVVLTNITCLKLAWLGVCVFLLIQCVSYRMDDAEACFILSSRNEVDRTAAVSSLSGS